MTAVVLSKTHLGSVPSDDIAFGEEMLDKFLHTMEREELRPFAICLYTDGVRLACDGSPTLLGLELLSGLGVKVLLCGSCVERFELTDRVKVGEIATMKDIVTILSSASRVLYP
jgi:hypothetical protein